MFRKLALVVLFLVPLWAHAETAGVMVVGFNLDDRTGIPNPPEELERIALLTKSMKETLVEEGVALVEPNSEIQQANQNNSATYLFDRVDEAAELAKDSNAKYLLIAVALKPTYLFVSHEPCWWISPPRKWCRRKRFSSNLPGQIPIRP